MSIRLSESRAYPIGYIIGMVSQLIELARRRAGLSQEDLAVRAGTSRTTLSAYEHGRKSPTMATAERILRCAGWELVTQPLITFVEVPMPRGRPVFVPDRLWRLSFEAALGTVALPLGLSWSRPGAQFALADRRQRTRCYEIVLREGMPDDLLHYIDGALLVDLWAELVLPREIRTAWQPVVE